MLLCTVLYMFMSRLFLLCLVYAFYCTGLRLIWIYLFLLRGF